MQTASEPYTIQDKGWIVRIQPPKVTEAPPRVLLLLHGWTGNETVMWIFTRSVPGNYWMFAPRGPVASPEGGYGWLPHAEGQHWPALDEFEAVAGDLIKAFHGWKAEAGAPQDPFDVMGFSQGAAMAYTLAAYYPRQVNRVMALAGFLPRDPETGSSQAATRIQQAYKGRKVYVAHGTADETVPVKMAQESVRVLTAAGAQVTYCESDVGHKLSADCLRGLTSFITG